MSIPNRLWRIFRSEVNHRLGRFEGAVKHPFFQEDFWQEVKDNYDGKDPTVAKHYIVLELPYGAPLPEVRAAYKRMMKKYHPDKFQDPERRAAATELVKKINEAYSGLVRHLETQPA